jgi:hypothetical protein
VVREPLASVDHGGRDGDGLRAHFGGADAPVGIVAGEVCEGKLRGLKCYSMLSLDQAREG